MKKSLSILVIDDDPEILEAVSTILKAQGHRPRAASTLNDECLKELTEKKYCPDLIILDILLSGLDGRELCRKLKEQGTTRDIPIIMFSAYPHAENSAKRAGAEAFLSKPFSLRDLNSCIKKILADKKIG